VDDPEARLKAQKALRDKQKSKGVMPNVLSMLDKALNKEGQMDDVSEANKSQI